MVFSRERVRNIDKVPEQVADDYEEAAGCLISGHYKAAAAMARRAVQGTCIDLGAKPGATLYGQIDDLQAQGHITKRLAELAHKIRVLGNDAAHPGKDGLDIVTAEEAKQTVDFLEHMLQHVFHPRRLGGPGLPSVRPLIVLAACRDLLDGVSCEGGCPASDGDYAREGFAWFSLSGSSA